MILGSGPWNGISETSTLASYLFFYFFTYKDGDILYWWKGQANIGRLGAREENTNCYSKRKNFGR